MTYVIAEIGQNHNGNFEIARSLIDKAKDSGADAVKLTIRDIDNEMTADAERQKYSSKNSYGRTYGSHRRRLELSLLNNVWACNHAKKLNLDVVITFCSESLLSKPEVVSGILPIASYIKVASRDITNVLLLERLNDIEKPIILSSGLSDYYELGNAIKILYKRNISILHCVSKYPTHAKDAYLSRITALRDRFNNMYMIGYSDHTVGYRACVLSVMLGVSIIEKHITLDKKGKGSDHCCSLEPSEFKCMVNEIKECELLLGENRHIDNAIITEGRDIKDKEINANRIKLMRSVCSGRNIEAGEELKKQDLCLLSPGDGIPGDKLTDIVGMLAFKDIPKHKTIDIGDLI